MKRSIVYKMAAASPIWLGVAGQQVPLGNPTTTDNMRPSITNAALLAGSTVHAFENLNGVVCSSSQDVTQC